MRRDYVANGGWETFLAYEDTEQDILVGLLRLRKCARTTFRPELLPQVQLPSSSTCASSPVSTLNASAVQQNGPREHNEKTGSDTTEAEALEDSQPKVCTALDFCGCSIVRELHVYGSVVPVSARDPTKFQHQACYS